MTRSGRHDSASLWRCALLCGLLLVSSSAATAQEEPDEADRIGKFSPQEARLRATLPLPELKTSRGQAPVMYIHEDELTRSWRVTITQETRGTLWELSSVTLPTWFGEPYYNYEVKLISTGRADEFYVLLEATPSEERGAPPSAFTMQLAWIVERPRRSNSLWKYITKAYQSDLDDSDQLLLQSAPGEKHGDLIRTSKLDIKKFCGVKSDFAQQEYYSPEKRIFLNKLDLPTLTKEATELRAIVPSTLFAREDLYGYVSWILATSDLRTPTDSTTILRPLELGDLDLATTWSEGALEDGRGEFVTAKISAALPLKGFRIYPGDGSSASAWRRSTRPKKILIGLSDGARFIIDLPASSHEALETSEGLLVEFPSPQNTSCLSVLLLESHPPEASIGKRSDFKNRREYESALAQSEATTIAEITPISVLQGVSSSAKAREILKLYSVDDDQRRRDKLIRLTRQDGQYIVEAIRESLRQDTSSLSRVDAAKILAVLRSDDAIPLLVELLETTEPQGDAWRTLRRSAAVHREEIAPGIWEILQRMPEEQSKRRVDLLRLLGRIAPAPILEELIPHLGEGTDAERNERIRALAHGSIEVTDAIVDALLETSISKRAKIDALKTLEVLARRHGVETFDEESARDLVAITRATSARRPLLRLIHIMEDARPQGSETLLAREMLLASRDTHVRRAAAKALSTHGGELSGSALRQALTDPSPDVRIAAINALMDRPDNARIASDVLHYVDNERWVEGLKPALHYLATLDDPQIDRKLSEWILDLEIPERAYLSAQAFERVRRAPEQPEVLTRNLFEPRVSYDHRRQLIEVLAHDRSEQGEQVLLSILTADPFNEVEPPRRIEMLKKQAIMALGTRRSQQAMPLFLRILTEKQESHKVKRTTLRALSFYTQRSLIEDLKNLKRDAPKELHSGYEETMNTISRRLDIIDAQKSIRELEEKDIINPSSRRDEDSEP